MIPEKLRETNMVSSEKGIEIRSPEKIGILRWEKGGWKVRGKGEGEGRREHEGTGCSRWGETERENKERDILI